MNFFRRLFRTGRIGSGRWLWGAARLWVWLFFGFFILFAVAWLFGYEPARVNDWLDAHGGLWRWIGGWLWRGFWGVVLLFCAAILFAVGLEWFGRKAEGFENAPRDLKGGCCALIAIVVVGYVAWIAIMMPID